MILVTLLLVHGRDRIEQMLWVLVISTGFYGVKAGIYTLLTGGGYGRVLGPPGGFFEESNALALTTIMTIPLMFYLFQQSSRRWTRWGLIVAMVLCAATVFGTTSRGGLLAIAAMGAFLVLKSHNKAMVLLLVPLVGLGLLAFMPEQWHSRMETIGTYEQDASAMGRLNAWWMAWNLAKDRFLGGGFEVITPELFARYAPDPLDVHAAHSIYFQVLGEHGFVGLGIFLLFWFLTWRQGTWVMRAAKTNKELAWAGRLAAMIQVSLVGYFVGGAFLSLAYFDLPYDLMVLLVAAYVCVQKQLIRPRPEMYSSGAAQAGTAHGG
jgi:probable O-glycosylation ligase (exosortase A-associated)